MEIIYYRYLISYGRINTIKLKVIKETPKCYFTDDNKRILKSDDNIVQIKDRTCYPYIDFYSTKDQSREYAVRKIIEYLTTMWGLN